MATASWTAPIADARADEYADYHARRMDYVLRASVRLRPDRNTAVLDVGRSVLTDSLKGYYGRVTTLGFPCGASDHIVFDLNDSTQGIDTPQRFDLVVFAEVIEHVHTAPETVLKALRGIMRPGAHMIVQTPNATDLLKRVKMLAGFNPYERIRTDTTNPGHFREYTKRELIQIAHASGFEVVSHQYAEYFGAYGGGLKRKVLLPILRAVAVLWPPLARGQTLVLRAH